MSLHFTGCLVKQKQMDKYGNNPNLGYCDRFEASLSSTSEVARHLNSVSSAAEVWVDPVSACQRVAAEEETAHNYQEQNEYVHRED